MTKTKKRAVRKAAPRARSRSALQEAQAKNINLFAETGTTGLRQWGGYIDEEFHRDLKGNKDIRVFTEMRNNSPVVGAADLATASLLKGVTLRVQPGEQSQEGRMLADFVDGSLKDMSSSWEDTLSEALTMRTYGWAWLETVYKYRRGENPGTEKDDDGTEVTLPSSRFSDGLISWRKWALRGQSSLSHFLFDRQGGVHAMVQDAFDLQGGVPEPVSIEKSALFRTSTEKGNPKGISMLRTAYLPYYAVKRIQAIEAMGIERDLTGYPVMYVPVEYLSAAAGTVEAKIRDYLKKMVIRVRRDEQEGTLLPMIRDQNGEMMFEFKLMASGGTRQFDTTKVIERYERRIAMAMLCDVVMLGHEKVGSFALADSKQDLLSVALGGIMDSILGVINRHLIPRLLRLNGFSVANPPVVTRGDITTPNLQELGQYIQALSGSGMVLFPTPSGDLERQVLGYAGLTTDDLGTGEVGKRNMDLVAMLHDHRRETVAMVNEIKTLVKAFAGATLKGSRTRKREEGR